MLKQSIHVKTLQITQKVESFYKQRMIHMKWTYNMILILYTIKKI